MCVGCARPRSFRKAAGSSRRRKSRRRSRGKSEMRPTVSPGPRNHVERRVGVVYSSAHQARRGAAAEHPSSRQRFSKPNRASKKRRSYSAQAPSLESEAETPGELPPNRRLCRRACRPCPGLSSSRAGNSQPELAAVEEAKSGAVLTLLPRHSPKSRRRPRRRQHPFQRSNAARGPVIIGRRI